MVLYFFNNGDALTHLPPTMLDQSQPSKYSTHFRDSYWLILSVNRYYVYYSTIIFEVQVQFMKPYMHAC